MFLNLQPRHYFKKNTHFYICSFGGCGSWIIAQYLSNFGIVHHVHSRKPPCPFVTTVQDEHFTNVRATTTNVVLYVYRDPVAALQSVQRRFLLSDHLRNIECENTAVTEKDICESQRDLIGLAEFDSNYSTFNRFRSYRIYCVKYEMFFDNLPEFNRTLGLVNYTKLYPVKKEKEHGSFETKKTLEQVYNPLRQSMRQRPFIFLS